MQQNIISRLIDAFLFFIGVPLPSLATDISGQITSAIVTVAGCYFIWRFGAEAVRNWEGPLRVSERPLSEDLVDKKLLTLAVNGAFTFLKRDPPANNYEPKWRAEAASAPNAPPSHEFLRELFLGRFEEARLPENGWRDRGHLWVGEMYGNVGMSTVDSMLKCNAIKQT